MLHEGLPGHPLPLAGGIYDQHPQLVDEWTDILAIKAKHEREEAKKRERAGKRGK